MTFSILVTIYVMKMRCQKLNFSYPDFILFQLCATLLWCFWYLEVVPASQSPKFLITDLTCRRGIENPGNQSILLKQSWQNGQVRGGNGTEPRLSLPFFWMELGRAKCRIRQTHTPLLVTLAHLRDERDVLSPAHLEGRNRSPRLTASEPNSDSFQQPEPTLKCVLNMERLSQDLPAPGILHVLQWHKNSHVFSDTGGITYFQEQETLEKLHNCNFQQCCWYFKWRSY